jgi:hypothetical protein
VKARVVIIDAGIRTVREVDAIDLATLQGIVGGYIEDVTSVVPGLPRGVRVIGDEEGRMKSSGRSFVTLNGADLVGPVVLVRAKGANYVGLTDADVRAVMS